MVQPGRHAVLLLRNRGESLTEELRRGVRIEDSSNLGLCDRTSPVPVLVTLTAQFPIGRMVRLPGDLRMVRLPEDLRMVRLPGDLLQKVRLPVHPPVQERRANPQRGGEV